MKLWQENFTTISRSVSLTPHQNTTTKTLKISKNRENLVEKLERVHCIYIYTACNVIISEKD